MCTYIPSACGLWKTNNSIMASPGQCVRLRGKPINAASRSCRESPGWGKTCDSGRGKTSSSINKSTVMYSTSSMLNPKRGVGWPSSSSESGGFAIRMALQIVCFHVIESKTWITWFEISPICRNLNVSKWPWNREKKPFACRQVRHSDCMLLCWLKFERVLTKLKTKEVFKWLRVLFQLHAHKDECFRNTNILESYLMNQKR